MLLTASQPYDPIGFLQPFILPVKILLQQLTKLDLGWDDEIPDNLCATWERWFSKLYLLEHISLPRCFMGCTEPQCLKLHCFCDGSASGCASFCYLCYKTNDSWKSSFVVGKARVATIKAATILRLELAATVTAVKLSVMIKQERILISTKLCFGPILHRPFSILLIKLRHLRPLCPIDSR